MDSEVSLDEQWGNWWTMIMSITDGQYYSEQLGDGKWGQSLVDSNEVDDW